MLDTEIKPPKKKQGKINVNTVIKGVLAGEKKIDIAPKAGSLAVRDNAKVNAINQVMRTNEYKEKTKSVLEGLKLELNRQVKAIANSNIDSTDYKDLVSSQEKTLKMVELLEGKPTERVEHSDKELKEFLDLA